MIQEKANQNHGKEKMNHRAFKLGEELLICTAILGGRGISPMWSIRAAAKTDSTTTTVSSSSSAAEKSQQKQADTAASSTSTVASSSTEASAVTSPSSALASSQATSESSSVPATSSSSSSAESSVSGSKNSNKTNQSNSNGIPTNYVGEQKDFPTGGGGSDHTLSPAQAGLASWNSVWAQNYDSDKLSCNTAITTYDGTVTLTNMAAVLAAANLTVNGQVYTTFVPSPMTVNGQSFAGYLTTSDGSYSSDYLIVVQNVAGFSVYDLGANFYYIKPKNHSSNSGDGGDSTGNAAQSAASIATSAESSAATSAASLTSAASSSPASSSSASSTYISSSEKVSQSQVDQVTFAHNSNVDTTDQVVPKSDEVSASQKSADVKVADDANLDNATNAEQATSSAVSADKTTASSATASSQSTSTSASTTASEAPTSLIQANLDSIPPVYDGKQTALAFTGGIADPSLAANQATLSMDNAVDTIPVGENEQLSFNTAIETSDGNVTSSNFVAVLKQANITVNDSLYNQVNIQPMTVNGVRYMGYLTTESGQLDSHFMILVKNLEGFPVSALNENFVIIDQEATQRPPYDVGMSSSSSGQTPSGFNPDNDFSQTTNASTSIGNTTTSDDTANTASQVTNPSVSADTIGTGELPAASTTAQNASTTPQTATTTTDTGKLPSDAFSNVSDTLANTIVKNLSVLTDTGADTDTDTSTENSSVSADKTASSSSSTETSSTTSDSSASSSDSAISSNSNASSTISNKSQSVINDMIEQVAIAIAPSITTINTPYVNAQATQIVSSLVNSTDASTKTDDLTIAADQAIVNASQQLSADTGIGAGMGQTVVPSAIEPAGLSGSTDTISTVISATSDIAGEIQDNTPADLASDTTGTTGNADATKVIQLPILSESNVLTLTPDATVLQIQNLTAPRLQLQQKVLPSTRPHYQ